MKGFFASSGKVDANVREHLEANGMANSRSELLDWHKRVLDRVRKMTPEEGFQSLVESGIYTADGKLAKEYGG